jgi:hypothetical protein
VHTPRAAEPRAEETRTRRTAQLQDDAEAVRLLRERVPVLVFVNNHHAGYVPATIDQLQPPLA